MNWTVSREDAELISYIVKAYTALGHSPIASMMDREMDLIACHLNGCPLDLKGLADADEFDMVHDVSGIRRHIDRTTGKLMDHFVPRYAK